MAKTKIESASGRPGHSPSSPIRLFTAPVVNTAVRRKAIRRLTDALYGFLTLDLDEMEAAAKAAAEMPPPSMADFQFPKYATTEMLVKATEERDALREQLEKTRAAMADAPEIMRGSMEAALVLPLEAALRHQEENVSRIQKDLEG
jgi:hypothetical protein